MPALRPPDPPLTDGLRVLRPPAPEDVAAIAAACVDPEVARWTMVPSPYTRADARDFVDATEAGWALGTVATFAITAGADGLVGMIDAAPRDPGVARMGYWVARHARGRGHATAALRLVSAWAPGAMGLVRMELLTIVGNTASERVAAAAGYRREGLLRAAVLQRGTPRDAHMWSRLPGEGVPSPLGAPPARVEEPGHGRPAGA